MSDWDKFVSFSSSKDANAIQFILVCVVLLIVLIKIPKNQQIGGVQRGGGGGDSFWWALGLCITGISAFAILFLIG